LVKAYKTYFGILTILITVIFPKLIKIYSNEYYYYLSLIICLFILWIVLFYYLNQKLKFSIQTNYLLYRFKHRKKLIFLVSIMAITGIFFLSSKLYSLNKIDNNKIVVLIIPFKNETDSTKDIFSSQLFGELNEKLDTEKDIKIELSENAISENEGGIKLAREIAKRKNASILIWGSYSKSPTNIHLKTKFEVLDPTLQEFTPDLNMPNKNNTFKIGLLNNFELQTDVTRSNSFLILSCLG